MADVRPFRGIRYNREAIGDLSLVVAPPYDVIDDAQRDSYYNKHPYNVIRLILNRPKKTDRVLMPLTRGPDSSWTAGWRSGYSSRTLFPRSTSTGSATFRRATTRNVPASWRA